MATPLVVGDILRVTLACRVPAKAQAGLNVLYYKVTSALGADLESLGQKIYVRTQLQYAAWLPAEAQYVGVSVSRVGLTKAGPFYYAVFPTTGQAGNGMVPLQASGLIRFTTPGDADVVPAIGPTKGRAYVPFVAVSSYSNTLQKLGTLGWQRLASIRSVLGPTMLLPSGPNLQLVLKRTKTNPAPTPPTLLGYTPVTQLTPLEAIATQRRRGDFGRLNAAFGGVI